MLILLSPSKTQELSGRQLDVMSEPQLMAHSQKLIELLQKMTEPEIAATMNISAKLARQTQQRHQALGHPFTPANSRQALLLFKGDVYDTLAADRFDEGDINFAQRHLRILSGLYGLLRPLDLIKPYRLEMGLSLATPAGRNLYDFWGATITDLINLELATQPQPLLVNLASDEYSRVIRQPQLTGQLLKVSFKEKKDGRLRVVAIHAKRARGLMARHIITQRITEPQDLKNFDLEGYRFEAGLSNEREWLFCREQ